MRVEKIVPYLFAIIILCSLFSCGTSDSASSAQSDSLKAVLATVEKELIEKEKNEIELIGMAQTMLTEASGQPDMTLPISIMKQCKLPMYFADEQNKVLKTRNLESKYESDTAYINQRVLALMNNGSSVTTKDAVSGKTYRIYFEESALLQTVKKTNLKK